MELSILVRSSEDPRLFDCIDGIDAAAEIVATLTPNPAMEKELERRGVLFALSPRGNPAVTTEAGLRLCRFDKVLLVDSDCVFFPGAIRRLHALSEEADIVRPTIDFEAKDFSSYATRVARKFQYTYCGFVYEPGLLVNRATVLPAVGGYLFSPHAPFTPDGEFDYRVRRTRLRIRTDGEPTLRHAALSFPLHLRSYWRYGRSEASRMKHLKQNVLRDVLLGLPFRYRKVLTGGYPPLTAAVIPICDAVYLTSMLIRLLPSSHP